MIKKILLADRDLAERTVLARTLKGIGFQVEEIESIAEIALRIEMHKAHLILVSVARDEQLLQAVLKLKRQVLPQGEIPIIALALAADKQTAAQFLAESNTALIIKCGSALILPLLETIDKFIKLPASIRAKMEEFRLQRNAPAQPSPAAASTPAQLEGHSTTAPKTLGLEQLDRFDVKAFPALVAQLMAIFADPHSSLEHVVAALEKDQALSARIIKIASSAAQELGKIRSLQQAVVGLGMKVVQEAALTVSLFESFSMDKSPQLLRCWEHSVASALLNKAMAKRFLRPEDAESAYLAGLMHDIGIVLFHQHNPSLTNDVYSGKLNPDIERAELEAFGIGHAAFGQLILEQWGFAQNICAAVGAHHRRLKIDALGRPTTTINDLATLLLLSETIIDFIGLSQMENPAIPAALPMLGNTQFSEDQLLEVGKGIHLYIDKIKQAAFHLSSAQQQPVRPLAEIPLTLVMDNPDDLSLPALFCRQAGAKVKKTTPQHVGLYQTKNSALLADARSSNSLKMMLLHSELLHIQQQFDRSHLIMLTTEEAVQAQQGLLQEIPVKVLTYPLPVDHLFQAIRSVAGRT